VLTWTAPGDDGSTGTATLYDIRYSSSPIVTLADFTAAALVSGEPAPAVAGTVQTMTVGGLTSNTPYYFVMKTRDEAPNISAVSNTANLATISGGGGGGGYIDSTGPLYSLVGASSITSTAATITWRTDESADSLVRFGTIDVLGGTAADNAFVLDHLVPLAGLTPDTTYNYTVCSRDAAGNQRCSSEFSFRTFAVGAAASGAYAVDSALASAPTINVDRGWVAPVGAIAPCISGALIKLPSDGNVVTQIDSTVYYCGADGRRHVFPNEATYDSWYVDFSGVQIVSAEALAAIPLGDNVTYRPGQGMVKIQTDPKVYAVAKGAVLRWVTTETIAQTLYGSNWNQRIIDISDALFANYTVGDPIM